MLWIKIWITGIFHLNNPRAIKNFWRKFRVKKRCTTQCDHSSAFLTLKLLSIFLERNYADEQKLVKERKQTEVTNPYQVLLLLIISFLLSFTRVHFDLTRELKTHKNIVVLQTFFHFYRDHQKKQRGPTWAEQVVLRWPVK